VNGFVVLELPFFILLYFVSLPLPHPHPHPTLTFQSIGWSRLRGRDLGMFWESNNPIGQQKKHLVMRDCPNYKPMEKKEKISHLLIIMLFSSRQPPSRQHISCKELPKRQGKATSTSISMPHALLSVHLGWIQ
jgi:hypothetical protein